MIRKLRSLQEVYQRSVVYGSYGATMRYLCNEEFFNQDNEQSFYWAGFIMADGCVKLKDQKYKQLSIGLAISDIDHIEKFKCNIKFEGPIFSGTYDGLGRCDVTISSDKIFDSLARFNIVPRKSMIAKFPEWLIMHPLVHHFMRGYFDGDGSIYTQDPRKNGRLNFHMSTRGTPDLLRIYRQILEENTIIKKRIKPIRVNSGQGVLEYGGNKIMLSIREFLYKNATIWLDRKHERFFSSELKLYPKGENLKLLHGKPSPKRKPIYGIGPDGQRIEFAATSLIQKSSGFDKSCIIDCLKGRASQHKGFTWHYV